MHRWLRCTRAEWASLCSVMRDISATMFNKRFMEELFKPQEIYSKKAMRTVFDRLAHASIMRLNTASMDKVRRIPAIDDTIEFNHLPMKLFSIISHDSSHKSIDLITIFVINRRFTELRSTQRCVISAVACKFNFSFPSMYRRLKSRRLIHWYDRKQILSENRDYVWQFIGSKYGAEIPNKLTCVLAAPWPHRRLSWTTMLRVQSISKSMGCPVGPVLFQCIDNWGCHVGRVVSPALRPNDDGPEVPGVSVAAAPWHPSCHP